MAKLKYGKLNPIITKAKSILCVVPTSHIDKIVCKIKGISYNPELENDLFQFVIFKDYSVDIVATIQLDAFLNKNNTEKPTEIDNNCKKVIDLFIEEVHLPNMKSNENSKAKN